MDHRNENSAETLTKTISYYGMDKIETMKVKAAISGALKSLFNKALATSSPGFVKQVFEDSAVASLLISLSRLPVFDKAFSEALKNDLVTLAVCKKLKFYTNLPVGQTVYLLDQLLQRFEADGDMPPSENWRHALHQLTHHAPQLSKTRFKEYLESETTTLINKALYEENRKALEDIDPHAVYPTSIYRHCDGLTLATPDSQTIEAVMSTTLTTTIKITRSALDTENRILADVYQPLGRVVALVDDKVGPLYGEKLNAYFAHFGVECTQLVYSGNEIDKDIQQVEKILVDLKNRGVARNEPVLIMGGGVLADIGGFATALYHRNTPYVMLCTSIVTGIDAGPSPRTCCDGFGFKNLYGAYHPPVLTVTDRSFWKTLHEGWIRHGIAEIIKMAVVKDKSLFELLEKAGPRLIRTKFGTEWDSEGKSDPDFERLCDLIVGKAMEGYVRSEYGNLWETHQCRPHAYGHTWSPGYELPAGMLHGHAVATCMGYGAYLAKINNYISEAEMVRIHRLIYNMELTLWHPIMDNHDLVKAANEKVIDKRGGNLCAPLPKPSIGKCGYLNELSSEEIDRTLNEYKAICAAYPRGGHGVDMHCHDVGLANPAARAGDALKGLGSHSHDSCSHSHDHDSCSHSHSHSCDDSSDTSSQKMNEPPTTYQDWIKEQQEERNAKWEMNVEFEVASDTCDPPHFPAVTLFQAGAEKYAASQTSVASKNLQNVANLTQQSKMFLPCMVGSLESQFLKMQAMIKGATRVLDVGTFTGMSAIAFAEGMPKGGRVVTVEFDEQVAEVAKKAIDQSTVRDKIELHVRNADELMREMLQQGEKFDIIFLDADKENYLEYYDLALAGLLAQDGIILADNSLCALLYDQEDDMRAQKLHEFNQHVKNDERVEQVVLTVREGVTLIRRKSICCE